MRVGVATAGTNGNGSTGRPSYDRAVHDEPVAGAGTSGTKLDAKNASKLEKTIAKLDRARKKLDGAHSVTQAAQRDIDKAWADIDRLKRQRNDPRAGDEAGAGRSIEYQMREAHSTIARNRFKKANFTLEEDRYSKKIGRLERKLGDLSATQPVPGRTGAAARDDVRPPPHGNAG
ncbi:hypothetical protein QYH69_10455 [Paraburkholderia sp. SARCC-3016]|nr:hypothetical protein [Paraburkholderia sp. SARCC-3016]